MAEAITSPDGKVQIVRHSITYPPMGPKSVQGAIKNISSDTVSAEIKVEFYDESDNMLGTSAEIIKDLAPGETRLFDVWAERLPNMYEIETHKIASLTTVS